MEKNQKKYVVLLSGGLDSTTCLALMKEKVGADRIIALNAYYGQKHSKEIECAQKIANYYGVEYYEIDLSQIFAFSNCPLLIQSTEKIKHVDYADQTKDGRVDTYVPFRNGLLLSASASFAMSKDCNSVVIGVHKDDSAGNAYPDCSSSFVNSMDEALKYGTDNEVNIIAPFLYLNKAEVVKAGLELNVPYELTWSCYEGGDQPCGECGTCRDRIRAFEANGAIDPLLERNETNEEDRKKSDNSQRYIFSQSGYFKRCNF